VSGVIKTQRELTTLAE